MTRSATVALAVAALVAATSGSLPAQQPSAQFRASTDLVRVEVIVRDGDSAVSDLRADDFRLLDNGVPQRIERLDRSTLPVDVTAIVDVSAQTSGALADPEPAVDVAVRVNDEVHSIASALRADDRLRVLAIDTYPRQLMSLRRTAEMPGVTVAAYDGLASVHDTIALALLQPSEPGRRHFVFVRTKAVDVLSAINRSALADLAARSDATLYVVPDDASLLNEAAIQDCQCRQQDVCMPTRQLWLPIRRRSPEPGLCPVDGGTAGISRQPRQGAELLPVLDAATSTTGGQMFGPGFFATRSLADVFRDAFDAYRTGYVLQYVATGVPRTGKHEITVILPGHPSYVVNARKSYWVDAAAPPQASTPMGMNMPGAPADLVAMADAFDREDWPALQQRALAVRDLAALLEDIGENPMMLPYGSRRDAVFVLEVARLALRYGNANVRNQATRLLAGHQTLVRHAIGPDVFECGWYQTEAAALTGLLQPDTAKPFVERSLTRCADNPRLQLALAILEDQKWPTGIAFGPGPRQTPSPASAHRQTVESLYTRAMQSPAVEAEARVRLAWFLYRTGEHARATVLAEAAAPQPDDRFVSYLKELVRGHAARAASQPDAAAAAWRRALEIWPGAQSARVALMTLELQRGNTEAAATLATTIEMAPDDGWDPWWQYWQGDFRAYSSMITQLKGLQP